MSEVSKAQLQTIMPLAAGRLDDWVGPINDAMTKYEINTPLRQAAWLANVAHETGQLKWVKEIWGPTPAQAGYEGREDLGNTQPGDGSKFRGRGLPQLTGRDMYTKYAETSGILCLQHPELLELPQWAADCGGWFWRDVKHMNPEADTGLFKAIVKKWNGGYNGWVERKAFYEKALAVL